MTWRLPLAIGALCLGMLAQAIAEGGLLRPAQPVIAVPVFAIGAICLAIAGHRQGLEL